MAADAVIVSASEIKTISVHYLPKEYTDNPPSEPADTEPEEPMPKR